MVLNGSTYTSIANPCLGFNYIIHPSHNKVQKQCILFTLPRELMCLYSVVPDQAADRDRLVEWQTHFACGCLDGVQIPTHYKIVGLSAYTRFVWWEWEPYSRDCLTIGRGVGGCLAVERNLYFIIILGEIWMAGLAHRHTRLNFIHLMLG